MTRLTNQRNNTAVSSRAGHQVTPPRSNSHVNPRQFYSKWSSALKVKINSKWYRYQIFIANPGELDYPGPLYNLVKRGIGKDVDETELVGWWNAKGIQFYRSTLNQKRQTLCNNVKLSVTRLFRAVKNQQDSNLDDDDDAESPPLYTPPAVEEIYQVSEDDGTISGLRELEGDAYKLFLKEFGKCVYGKDFEENACATPLRKFLPTCMEAFLVVAYTNGYEKWRHDGLGGDKTESPPFKFTENSKGARPCEGWSDEGVKLYDALYDLIKTQRQQRLSGEVFDRNLLLLCASKSRDNGREKHRNDLDGVEQYGV